MPPGDVYVICVRILNVTVSRSPSSALCHSTRFGNVFFLPAKHEIHCQLTVVQFVAFLAFLSLFKLRADSFMRGYQKANKAIGLPVEVTVDRLKLQWNINGIIFCKWHF